MMKSFQKLGLSVLLVFSLMATSGCVPLIVGAVAGAGGITYVRGALVRNIDKPVASVHKASLAALKILKLFIVADELQRHSAVIKAEYDDGKRVRINIDAITEYTSKITVRVGIIGDQEKSKMILNTIQKKL